MVAGDVYTWNTSTSEAKTGAVLGLTAHWPDSQTYLVSSRLRKDCIKK